MMQEKIYELELQSLDAQKTDCCIEWTMILVQRRLRPPIKMFMDMICGNTPRLQ